MRNKALILLLALAAAVLCAVHMRVPYNTVSRRMTATEAAPRADDTMPYTLPDGDIDPNTAGLEKLDELPGVGPATAQAIVDEREQNGPFYYPEDLINVKGIGEKTMLKMLERLKLP